MKRIYPKEFTQPGAEYWQGNGGMVTILPEREGDEYEVASVIGPNLEEITKALMKRHEVLRKGGGK